MIADAVVEAPPDTIIGESASAIAPPPRMTISDWADANRYLPSKSAARGGRWKTATTPYLRGVMDAVLEPGVKKIALMKGAQVGATEGLIGNVIGFHIHHDPCAMSLVFPTSAMAIKWSKNRLDDMIATTAGIREAIDLARSSLEYKDFVNGSLALAGANTPNSFAGDSVRIAFADDCDRFPAIVGEEGDPAELLANRTSSFYDGLTIFVSTPTLKDGRIDTLFKLGDQRRYFVTCPHCGREDYITWSDAAHFRVGYDDGASTARLECPPEKLGGCGAHLNEAARRRMVLAGDWMATAIAQEEGLISFHLPGMLSTLGDVTLSSIVNKWLSARKSGQESTKVFINTQLGEPWEVKGVRMDPHALMSRRESYGAPGVEVPAWAVAITAGIDVQNDRLEMMVTAWGHVGERAVIDWRQIRGELKNPETRTSLVDALNRKYAHACGADLPIHATCIDSGYQTDDVYSFVLSQQGRRVYATKGIAKRKGEPIVGKPSEKRTGKDGRPVALYPVNVDDAKSDVMSAMHQATETVDATSIAGAARPNCMHFPLHVDTVDDEFFAQLCSEHLEKRYNKFKVATHEEWVKDRERNEAWDAAVLCLAAFKLLRPNIRQMLEALPIVHAKVVAAKAEAAKAVGPTAPGTIVAPAPARATPPKPTGRRVARSSYLNR